MTTDANGTADGWYIDDVAVLSTDFETAEPPPPPPAPRATLDGPAPNSFQSGIGLIYGWACEAEEIVIELAGTPVPAAYGTPRADTQGVCGDSNNGFGLPMNWNLLGNGGAHDSGTGRWSGVCPHHSAGDDAGG